jgi:hypothetical protein
MCDTPYYVDHIPVGCGRCPTCKRNRINQWVFRLLEEERECCSSYFVTLTYKDTNLNYTTNGYPTLDKRDLQLFFKRLRKKQPEHKIKYYAVGEYGSKGEAWNGAGRPHYHIILLNVIDIEYIAESWKKKDSNGNYDMIGTIDIGQVSGASIAYTAKYIDKPHRIPTHELDDRVPEFSHMSKGLGKNYIARMGDYHRGNIDRMYLTTISGHKIPMPKYYKERLYTEEEREAARPMTEHAEHEKKVKELQYLKKKYKLDQITFEDWRNAKKFKDYDTYLKSRRETL